MSGANPLWGAPRIQGELLQARHRGQPSDSRQVHGAKRGNTFSELEELPAQFHAEGIAAIDTSVLASASFRLLYVTIILARDRKKIVFTAVTEHPTAAWLSRRVTEAFPWAAPCDSRVCT